MIAFFAVMLVFSAGASTGVLLRGRALPNWGLALISVVGVATFMALARALPFKGALTELPLIVAGALAVAGPLRLFFGISKRHQDRVKQNERRDLRLLEVVALGLIMPMLPMVLFTLLMRLNFADGLSWDCDGVIVERARHAGNHNLPYLVVRGERTVKLEPVSEGLWESAREGQHLTKRAGSRTAVLDGVAYPALLNDSPWWDAP